MVTINLQLHRKIIRRIISEADDLQFPISHFRGLRSLSYLVGTLLSPARGGLLHHDNHARLLILDLECRNFLFTLTTMWANSG